mmetsp:Transcript_18143/g.23511  ORF Transcript_18143/g.23511 Transcript_18143/m.23511 type:complete len:91 (+) Transcript_18143:358-630(+)
MKAQKRYYVITVKSFNISNLLSSASTIDNAQEKLCNNSFYTHRYENGGQIYLTKANNLAFIFIRYNTSTRSMMLISGPAPYASNIIRATV